MSKPLSQKNRDFLRYIDSQREHNGRGRIDIGFIDGSTRPIEPLTRLGYLRREGHDIVITDEGREALRR